MIACAALAAPVCRLSADRASALDAAPVAPVTNIDAVLAEVGFLRSYRNNWPNARCHSVDARLALLRAATDSFDAWCADGRRRPDSADSAAASATDQRLSCPELSALCVAGNNAAPSLLARLCPQTNCEPAEYTLWQPPPARRRCNRVDDDDCRWDRAVRGRYNVSAHVRPNCSCPRTEVARAGPLQLVDCTRHHHNNGFGGFGGPEPPPAVCDCRACIKTVTVQNISCKFASSVLALKRVHNFAPQRQPLNVTTNLRRHCPETLAVCATTNCADQLARAACPRTCAPPAGVCAAAAASRNYAWLRRFTKPVVF